ncbi:thioesterase family protein [Xylariomycetidae sp. FL0641]|nr:thioesterase family protein [Xylariomycetidae sp. FL0641]
MAGTLRDQINLQKVASNTYTAGWHLDWTLGSTLFGGSITAILHCAAVAHLTTDPALSARNQPDILNLHIEFLRSCERAQSTIVVSALKIGATTSTLQLQLLQNDKIKALALAASTNFDISIGPTVPTAWSLLPPPKPKPDFARVLAFKPDQHWIPARLSGEIINITEHLLVLDPRNGFPTDGLCDAWNGCLREEDRIDATFLTMMTDIIPSMSDTLLRNGGLYDAHAFYRKTKQWADNNPGVPAEITNSVAEALQAEVYNNTVTLDIGFKRRLPKEGLRFIFTRTAAKMLHGGRMDVDITMCNEDMELVCLARQLIVVLEAGRKFRRGRPATTL